LLRSPLKLNARAQMPIVTGLATTSTYSFNSAIIEDYAGNEYEIGTVSHVLVR